MLTVKVGYELNFIEAESGEKILTFYIELFHIGHPPFKKRNCKNQ